MQTIRFTLVALLLATAALAQIQPTKPIAPAPPVPGDTRMPDVPEAPEPQLAKNKLVTIRDGENNWTTSTNGTTFKIESRGKIEISANDKDVVSISDDGYLVLSKTVFGSKHKVDMRQEGNTLRKRYYQGSREKPWEPDGRKWLAEILPELVLTSTLGAESRVERFYKQGGVSGVLKGIDELQSDFARQHYGDLLLKYPLSDQQIAEAFQRLSKSIQSDYYLATLLTGNLEKGLKSQTSSLAYIQAINGIASDFYRSSVLQAVIKKGDGAKIDLKKFLDITRDINSDFYKASVLEELARYEGVSAYQAEYFEIAATINSDFYRAAALNKGFEQMQLTNIGMYNGLKSWSSMSSDFYQQDVLLRLLKKHRLTPEAQKIVLTPIGARMSSALYKHDVLRTFAKTQKMTEENFALWLAAAATINSDFYLASALNSYASVELSESQLTGIFGTAAKMSSDFYKAEVLGKYAAAVSKGSPAARTAFTAAAKTINSTHYYGEVMRKID
jgi:hypothetical protein